MSKRLMLMMSVFLLSGVIAAQDTSTTATAYGTVNVRSGPGAQYEIVGRLEAGDRVPVNGRDAAEDSRWLRVVLPSGVSGWVASFAIALDGEIANLPVITDDTDDEVLDERVTITAYGLVNVRGGPSMSYPITGQLDVDDVAEVTGRSNTENDWLFIENDDLNGWVAYFTVTVSGDLELLPVLVVGGSGEDIVSPDQIVSARYNVRLRAQPEIESVVLEIVPFRSVVTPLARDENGVWVYVVYQDVYGWSLTRLFEMTAEQVEALPVFGDEFEVSPVPEVTPNPDAEG